MGERAPIAIAKACRGETLSEEDAVVLTSRFQVLVMHIGRQQQVEAVAGFESENWKARARGSLLPVFATQEGRSWWKSMRRTYASFSPDMVRLGDEILEGMGPPDCGLDMVMEPDT